MATRTRKKVVTTSRIHYKSADFYSHGVLLSPGTRVSLRYGRTEQVIDTYPHTIPKRSFRDYGGPVVIQKKEYLPILGWVDMHQVPTGNNYTYHGPLFYGVPSAPNFPPIASLPSTLSDSVLLSKGASAWAKFKPTAQRGQLGQALGELHELPHLPHFKELRSNLFNLASTRSPSSWRKLLKQSGGEYLNVVFGWLPLLQDIQALIRNIQHLDENYQQLVRDNGRPVRRSGSVGKSVSSSSTSTSGAGISGWFSGPPVLNNSVIASNWTKTVTTTIRTDYRFSARFRYWLPNIRSLSISNRLQLSRILLGAELDPYVLYQLMPWSWLLDWFTSTGDVINNLVTDSQDNLVADYAYVNGRETTEVLTLVTQAYDFQNGQLALPKTNPLVYNVGELVTTTSFSRIKASPYGFGLTLAGLSLRQKAILAALGLSRLL